MTPSITPSSSPIPANIQLYHQNYDNNTDSSNMAGVYIPSQTRLDSNGAIFSFNTFINPGSGTVGCRGAGAWQIQSTNYSVTANTTHSVTVTYFTGGTWGALTGAYLTISIYNTSTDELTGSGLLITPSTPNGTDYTVNFTPLPGVTYKIFGSIALGGDGFVKEPVCRPNHANSTTIYFDSYSGGEPNNPVGFASSTAACTTGTGGIAATVYYDGTFGASTTLYTNSYSNDLWDNNGGYFFKDGYSFQLSSGVINNYTVCPSPTPTPSVTPSTTPPAPTAVYINVIVPYTLGCYNYGDFCASSYDVYSNPINVDTTVQVQTYWNGDLGGQIYATVDITSGNNCGTGIAYTGGSINCAGEYYSYDSTTTVPTTSGTQDYYINSVGTDNFNTCPC